MTNLLTLTVKIKGRGSNYNDPSGYEDIEIKFQDGDLESILPALHPLVVSLARVAYHKYDEERIEKESKE